MTLSKSRLLSFRQCPLRLWNEIHRRELAQEPDPATQFRFDEGTRVGELTRKRYTDGLLIDAEYWNMQKALKQTRDALSNPAIPALFEAAFTAQWTTARNDILIRKNATDWEMWEVKSVGTPREIHVLDLAVQVFITRQWAVDNEFPLNIMRCGILHLNKEYVYQGGNYDVQALFSEYDSSEEIEEFMPEVEQLIAEGLQVADSTEPPTVSPGLQCFSPYECPFSGTACEVPESDELNLLYRISAKKLDNIKARGIRRIDELSDDDPELSEIQRRTVKAWKTGQTQLASTLKKALNQIGYPRYHLDFETVSPVLPRYPGTRPFQTLPFQFSIHTEFSPGGSVIHGGYLHEEDTDPRRPLAEAMLETLEAPEVDSVRANAPVLCYSSYEKRIINELADSLPDLAARLIALRERLVDLLPIVRNNVYDKAFEGGFSIKKVLPALVPNMGYDDLEIADGGTASLMYLEMLECLRLAEQNRGKIGSIGNDEEVQLDPLERAKKIRTDLWLYCQRDTEAMVYLLKALKELAI